MSAEGDAIARSESLEHRLNSLEERVNDLERENKQLREAVEEERAERRALVETLGDVDPTNAGLNDVTLAGAPIGRMFKSQKEEREALADYVLGQDGPSTREEIKEHIDSYGTLPKQLETGEMTVTHGGLTDAVRQRLLPIHEMWIDVREGREGKLPNDSVRRGARLFGRFIRKASGEASVGVDATYGTYSMDSKSAREILAGAGDMTASGKTMTVKRAMKAVQSMSKRQDCGCDTAEECEHAVVVWDNDGGHSITANKDEFNALMADVEAAINGEIGGSPDDTDDEGNSSEVAVDDESAFDELDGAEAVTNDEDDSVKGEVANTAVSHRDGPALDAEQPPTRDT